MTLEPATRRIPLFLLSLSALALAAPASRAQESVTAAPAARDARLTNALEIAVGVGSAQGYGNLAGSGPSLEDLGVGLDLSAGWRIDPRWMVGAYGTAAAYPAALGSTSWTTSAGVQVNRHFDVPLRPWVGLGAGWRGYWLSQNGGRTSYQGLDLARVQVGVEAAVTRGLSIEPVVGVTLSTFLAQKGPAAASFADVQDRSVSVSVLAGVIGRFDLFGRPAGTGLIASNP